MKKIIVNNNSTIYFVEFKGFKFLLYLEVIDYENPDAINHEDFHNEKISSSILQVYKNNSFYDTGIELDAIDDEIYKILDSLVFITISEAEKLLQDNGVKFL